MNKKAKIIILSCILVLMCLILACKYIVSIYDLEHVKKNEIVKEYKNNKEVFTELSKYAKDIPEDITIDKENKNTYTISKLEDTKVIEINTNNKKLNDKIIYFLYNLKFKHIVEDGNGVYFLRQTNVGFEQGIVFSKDGNKPNWPLIKVLEPIEDDWYYYESK